MRFFRRIVKDTILEILDELIPLIRHKLDSLESLSEKSK